MDKIKAFCEQHAITPENLIDVYNDYLKQAFESAHLYDVLKNANELCNLITNSPPETTIKGEIESKAHWIAHNMMQLRQYEYIQE